MTIPFSDRWTNIGSRVQLNWTEQLVEVSVFLFLIVPSLALSFFAIKQGSLSFTLTAVANYSARPVAAELGPLLSLAQRRAGQVAGLDLQEGLEGGSAGTWPVHSRFFWRCLARSLLTDHWLLFPGHTPAFIPHRYGAG